jgi:hypothetical protein
MLCVPPNFLQILAHMPVIGLPRHITACCPQGMLYARPKSRGEHGISIWYNGHWNPMESYHLVYVDLSKLIYQVCNIPHSGIKKTISCQPKKQSNIYIHDFRIKIYRNFDGVPPIPEGPKLSTCNLFTLLITHISLNPDPIILGFNSTNIFTPINHNIYYIHYITKYHYGWIKI